MMARAFFKLPIARAACVGHAFHGPVRKPDRGPRKDAGRDGFAASARISCSSFDRIAET